MNSIDIFLEVADNNNLSLSALEKRLGASAGVLTKAKRNNSDVSMKWLLTLKEKFPNDDIGKYFGTTPKNIEDSQTIVSEPFETYEKAELSHVILSARDQIQQDIKNLHTLLDATAVTLSRGMQRGLEYQLKVVDFIEEVKEAGAMDALDKLNLFLNKEKV